VLLPPDGYCFRRDTCGSVCSLSKWSDLLQIKIKIAVQWLLYCPITLFSLDDQGSSSSSRSSQGRKNRKKIPKWFWPYNLPQIVQFTLINDQNVQIPGRGGGTFVCLFVCHQRVLIGHWPDCLSAGGRCWASEISGGRAVAYRVDHTDLLNDSFSLKLEEKTLLCNVICAVTAIS